MQNGQETTIVSDPIREVKCYFQVGTDENGQSRKIIIRCDNVGCDGRPLERIFQEQRFIDGNWKTCKFNDFADIVNELVIGCSGDTIISDDALKLLPDLARIEIHGDEYVTSKISIPRDEFKNMQHLTRLHMERVILDPDTISSIRSAINLEMLTIDNCNLQRLASDMFQGLEKLWFLKLSMDNIEIIEAGTFDGLESLTHLVLQENRIEELPSGLFKNTPKLKSVDLSFNGIKILTAGVFEGASSVTELILRCNQMETIEPNALKDLCDLEFLYLEKNCLMSLPTGGFCSDKLIQISLARNEIQSLSWLPSCGIGDVHFFDISYNKINMLPHAIFNKLTNLSKLNLKNNMIKFVPDYMFGGLKNLTDLDLRCNKIEKITEHMFRGLEKLQCLNLISNKITSVEAGAFNDLIGLKQVFLQENKIDWMPEGLFNNAKALWRIDLSGNPVAPTPVTSRLRHFGRDKRPLK